MAQKRLELTSWEVPNLWIHYRDLWTQVLLERGRALSRVEQPDIFVEDGPGASGDEIWELDAHWTALTTYLAHLYFPNEG